MKRIGAAFQAVIISLVLTGAAGGAGSEEPLVDILTLAPDVTLDIRYATANNLMRQVLYDSPRCLLRKSVAERAARVHEELKTHGFRLRMYDCYRPLSVQKKMWKMFPKPGFVADPVTGSNHNRGSAVDVGLSLPDGTEVEMPSPYDRLDETARSSYAGGSETARRNREILKSAMKRGGFFTIIKEWWHFNAPRAAGYSILDLPLSTADGKPASP